MSRPSQVLASAALLLFVFLFFDWQQHFGQGRSGWSGSGVAAGIFTIALVGWEAAQVLDVSVPRLPVRPAVLSTILAGAVLLFTAVKFFVDDRFRHWPAWVGLILAIAIGIGGFLRWLADAKARWTAGAPR